MTKSNRTEPHHSLKLLCWNINHSRDKFEGPKVEIPEVCRLLNNHDIFAMQETKGEINFQNYCCFNSNRQGSNSGGVCIGVHKSLKPGVSRVKVDCTEDIVAVKLKSEFFNLDNDTNLINVYDSPMNGSFKKRKKLISSEEPTTLEHLQEVIASIPIAEDIILLGDFNARTSTLSDILPHDAHNNEFNPGDENNELLPKRNNSDPKLNTNGRPFIELLQSLGLVILNGRTLGDIFGAPTCIQRMGASCVDYICTSPSLHKKVRSFKVENVSHYSDHRPLSMTLSTNLMNRIPNNIPMSNVLSAPSAFKWIRSEHPAMDTSMLFLSAQQKEDVVNKVEELLSHTANSGDDVLKLNKDVVNIFTQVAASVTTKKGSNKRTNKKKWFDMDCRIAKRAANQAERKVSQNPFNQRYRDQLLLKSKEYRAMKRSKKGNFLYEMNNKINGSDGVDWTALKHLSDEHKDEDQFDIYDLILFHKFFNDLYNKKCGKESGHINDHGQIELKPSDHIQSQLQVDTLNRCFSLSEMESVIKRLKSNKSVSEDLISNEMLKHMSKHFKELLLKLFNDCLQQGVYPWNRSITTPLHKKGDRQNPDNYRAITVGSCLGKLFSSLLLKRLLDFREVMCPDYPNQLGFRSGAQCNDHILTLNTIIEKYVRVGKKRLFACFVDYRKAFDTVCREALLFKLDQIGIAGNFFKCISYMYNNSCTRIKLIKKLSAAIDVTIGTEQGHPMSPELFKLFIHDLSMRLEAIDELDLPQLNGFKVSHLLWADDLVLLALDPSSLQKLLDCLYQYAERWELSVNIGKTNIMVFNTSARILKCAYGFKLGDLEISPVRTYCYLGIQFSLNGSFKQAIDLLRKKALRAFFSIKRILDTRALTTSTMLTLMDSLVKPVATYGCAVWLPSANVYKALLSLNTEVTIPKAAAKDALELTHLKILKWVLGVHKKTNNNFCYGDTGRLPWTLTVLPQCIRYYLRASTAVEGNVNTLLYHTFQEQKELNLSWYHTWSSIISCSTIAKPDLSPVQATYKHLHDTFINHWSSELLSQSKMSFYVGVKHEFREEQYLNLSSRTHRINIAKLRASSHDLRIERGRYTKSRDSRALKACRHCCNHNMLVGLIELPFSTDPILETEEHVLTECPKYHQLRSNLSDNLKSLILLKAYGTIMSSSHIYEFGKYLTDCHRLRNPAKTPPEPL